MAAHDGNFIYGKIGVLCTDGVTLVPIAISSTSGGVMVDSVSTIGFTPGSIDFNASAYQSCWFATNSSDGTPIPIFVNASGAILVDNA